MVTLPGYFYLIYVTNYRYKHWNIFLSRLHILEILFINTSYLVNLLYIINFGSNSSVFTRGISRANPIPGNFFHRFFGQPEDFEIITEIETGTNYYKRIHNVI